MDDNTTLIELESLATRLGITVRYEPLNVDGVIHAREFCRVKGQDFFVIINNKATSREKVLILIDTVKRCDLRNVYITESSERLSTIY